MAIGLECICPLRMALAGKLLMQGKEGDLGVPFNSSNTTGRNF